MLCAGFYWFLDAH